MADGGGEFGTVDEDRLDRLAARRWRDARLALVVRSEVFDPAMAPALRRFACACCRAVESLLIEADSREVLNVIERFAFGRASFEVLVIARQAAKLAARRVRRRIPKDRTAEAASEAVCHAGRNQAVEALLLTSQVARRARLSVRAQAELFSRIWADAKREARIGL